MSARGMDGRHFKQLLSVTVRWLVHLIFKGASVRYASADRALLCARRALVVVVGGALAGSISAAALDGARWRATMQTPPVLQRPAGDLAARRPPRRLAAGRAGGAVEASAHEALFKDERAERARARGTPSRQ